MVEVRSIMIAFMTLIVLGVLGIVGYEIYNLLHISPTSSSVAPDNESVTLLTSLVDGRTPLTLTQTLPPSLNQDEGLEFAFTSWLYVTDFDYNAGNPKYIFHKGDAAAVASSPAAFFDATTNSLHIKQDTFAGSEDILIQSIPTNNLIHLAINVTQTNIMVYIDGILKEFRALSSLPKQNTGSVYIAANGGFNGRVGPLTYYNYTLTSAAISALAQQPPPAPVPTELTAPPYFDSTWYTNN